MIINLFLINLKNAIQHKKHQFNSPYNIKVLRLINLLITLNIIKSVKKNIYIKEQRIIIYLSYINISKWTIKINNMNSRKKNRTWACTVLIKKSQRNETYILNTNQGYQTSYRCLQKNIGGKTILQLKY